MPLGKLNPQKKHGLGQENSSPGLQRLNPELHFWKLIQKKFWTYKQVFCI